MKLDVSTLESWPWEAACIIRGPVDASKFKDYILPLIFLKRLSDVFEDEIRNLARDFGGEAKTLKLAGRVTFDSDLLCQHADFRQRVIVEELLHLKVPNHGKLFRTLLRTYLRERK
jgi:hypothetical protein